MWKKIFLSIVSLVVFNTLFSQGAFHSTSGAKCIYNSGEDKFNCSTELKLVEIHLNETDLNVIITADQMTLTLRIIGKEYNVKNNSWVYTIVGDDGEVKLLEHLEFDSKFILSPVQLFNGSVKMEYNYH